MKKLNYIFALLLAISLCGCGASTTGSDTDEPSGPASSTNEAFEITEEEALEIASKHWGIKSGDKDEATGFSFLIVPVESSSDNIAIALKWLVNDHHYSTVESIEIDPYTGKIVNIN